MSKLFFAIFLFSSLFSEIENKTLIYDNEIEKRVGQMIITGFRGVEVDDYITSLILDLKVGGVVLFDYDVPSRSFARNIINESQLKKLTLKMQSLSDVPLFISVDCEGGAVNRLKHEYGFYFIPSPEKMCSDAEDIRNYSSLLSSQLHELGFNMNFAPVVDINVNPKNPIIGKLERSFSEDPEKVINCSKIFIESQSNNNIISVLKHFPGHGSSFLDSHTDIVDVTESYKEEELLPYQEIIKEDLIDAIMTGHIINKKIDSVFPASLSSLFIKDLLRDNLKFKGLIITDDIQMSAVSNKYSLKELVILAINAGNDIILVGNNFNEYNENLPYDIKNIIISAVKSGEISTERIIESSNKIYSIKEKWLKK